MKKEKISDILENISTKYIDEAAHYPENTDGAAFYPKKKKLRFSVLKWGAAAACLAVLIIGGAVVLPSVRRANTEVGEPESVGVSASDNTNSASHENSASKPTDDKNASNISENSSSNSENTSAPESSDLTTENNSGTVNSENSGSPDNDTAKPVNSEATGSVTSGDRPAGSTPVPPEKTGYILPFSELERPYKKVSISTDETARLWEWEYLTLPEQYTSMELYGKVFYSRREIDEALLGETLGSYEVSGTDWYTDQTYSRTFEVRKIKGVSDKLMTAVNMDGKYYIFKNSEYDPPSTLGEVLDSYSLADTVELHRFTTYEGYSDKDWYALENDGFIWVMLADCRDAAFVKEDFADRSGENGISFSVTSEALGVYKNVLSISENGYLRTNIFDWGYNFYIGEEAANKIISYATENATPAKYEPYTYSLAGTLTEIHDGYFLFDDSVLCADPSDGVVFKVATDDIRIRRCVDADHGEVKVGDLISVSFTGGIDKDDSNRITEVWSVSRAFLYDGDVLIPE